MACGTDLTQRYNSTVTGPKNIWKVHCLSTSAAFSDIYF